MPLDPRAKRFLDILAATNPPSALSLSVEERRAALAQLMKFGGPEEPVARLESRSLPGAGGPLAVRVYTPLGADLESMPGLLYFHGGGLVAGTIGTHDAIGRALANAGACRVLSVDYRLAPEHRFPAAIEDASAAVRYIAAHGGEFGIDPARLGVCGDSAGATLAAVACQVAARSGTPPLALQLLICPILDYAGSTDSRRALATGYLVDQATLDHDLLHYVPPGTDPADPRVSPLRAADLRGLPPTAIHTAEFDPLRDEGKAYAERLKLGGTPVSYTCHPGMIHLFYGLAAVIPYAHTAFEQIGAELRAALADPKGCARLAHVV
jgi:acetyl esterase/lipase